MRIKITLSNIAGELDRHTFDSEGRVAASIMEALKVWELDVGDVIKIEEVPDDAQD